MTLHEYMWIGDGPVAAEIGELSRLTCSDYRRDNKPGL
jgi:hypothetical protein